MVRTIPRTWLGQFHELYFLPDWLITRCKLRPELAADEHEPTCRLKSSQYTLIISHRVINSTKYYIILDPRDKAAPPTSQQIGQFPPKRVKYRHHHPVFLLFSFSSSYTGELFAFNKSEGRFAELGEYSQNMLSEGFWAPHIASSQFDKDSELGSRSKSSPN